VYVKHALLASLAVCLALEGVHSEGVSLRVYSFISSTKLVFGLIAALLVGGLLVLNTTCSGFFLGDTRFEELIILLKGLGLRNIVKELRSLRGWTQEELASRLAVSRQTIISIEGGRYDPSLTLALKLASLLERRVEELFFLPEE
jgi:putative transcriptional regulator